MRAFIRGVSYYLPMKCLTNDQLIHEFPEWSVEKVANKIGIHNRHLADEGETVSEMASKAAEKLFTKIGFDRTNVDFIILCTQSPDYFLPTTACVIQDKLEIPTSAGAVDINQGCSGYIYGLSLAKGLVAAGIANNILLLTAETYSKYIHERDKSNRSIFGDAASATLISVEGFAEIKDFVLGSDGSGANDLIVKTGASKHPKSLKDANFDHENFISSSDHLFMNGSNVFNFTLKAVPGLVSDLLLKNQICKEEIDYFIFHQANEYMLKTLRRLCKIDEEKFIIDMKNTGNTVSSTIPIALSNLLDKPEIAQSNRKIMLTGFGVGYSWAGCVLQIPTKN